MRVGGEVSHRGRWFVLRYPRRVALAGWVSTALLVGAIVAAAMAAEPHERPLIWACLVFSPATALLVVEAYWVRHGVGPTGVGYRGLLARSLAEHAPNIHADASTAAMLAAARKHDAAQGR